MSSRVRGWLLYALAWVPVAAAYGHLIGRERGVSGWEKVSEGAQAALLPAFLGVIVWWITGRVRWPAQRPVLFFLAQILLAAAYSTFWLLLVVGGIAKQPASRARLKSQAFGPGGSLSRAC